MGEILIDEPDLIIDDPAGDCMDYWTALVKEDKTNNNILQTEQTVQVNLFEKNTGHKKQPKEKKNELRKKIKNILRNSTFPPEQIRKAIEGYAQDPSLMEMRIDQVDPSSIFLFDVCSENFSTAFEFERKGMLQPIEDAEFNWQTFQDCKEMNLLSKHQDDFEPGEVEDEEEVAPRKKSCRTERYESPEKPKRRQDVKESTKPRYQDRRQDEQTKENDREKERDRERRNSPEKKRLVKLKDQKDASGVNQEEEDLFKRKERKSSRERERDNEKEKLRHNRKTSREDRDQKSKSNKSGKEQSRDKERDRSREKISRKRSSSQERRRENYASRRDEDGYRRPGRKEQDQELTRSHKALRPYDNQAQKESRDERENGNNKNGYQDRMNRSYNENQRNIIIDVDEKESRDNTHKNYRDDNRTKKVTVIDDEDLHEPRNSSKYANYNNDKPRQFDPDKRKNYQQQENPFNNQFQAKPTNEMGQVFMQMVAQMVANQISSNPNMANMMGQFMSGGNNGSHGGGFPNRYQQKPYFNNNNKRYQNNYNNDRGGFQRKPFYSGNDENDRRRKRSNSNDRNKDKADWKAKNDEVTRRRNY